jgi:pyrroline-5-carboxylate reductase
MARSRRIAILGAGRLGESLLRGLLSSGWRGTEELVVTARGEEHLVHLREAYGVEATGDNASAVQGAGLVVVAVKPQDMATVLAQVADAVTPDQTILSVAAGITTKSIEAHLPAGARVVRAMPNAPALVHEGIAGICAGAAATDDDLLVAEEALGHVGSVVRVAEVDMDAVTALSGSGPAYFALLAEAMIEAGILLGLSREISTQLVVQTMLGTAKQLRDRGLHPVELREMVTSPGGTTIAAIRELEQAGVRAAFLNAIQAAMDRSRELARGDS